MHQSCKLFEHRCTFNMALQSLRTGLRLATRPSCSFLQSGVRAFATAPTEQQVRQQQTLCYMHFGAFDCHDVTAMDTLRVCNRGKDCRTNAVHARSTHASCGQ